MNGVEYSYKNNDVYASLDFTMEYGVNHRSIEDKLNIIYNVLNIDSNITKKDIKDIIKKYYNLDEEIDFPEELDIYIDKNSATNFVLSKDTYEIQNSYGVINSANVNGQVIDTTSGYLLGLLHDVKDEGDKITITEKVFSVYYDGGYKINNLSGEEIVAVNKLTEFDISKYYDSICTYDYIFNKRNDGTYYLSQIESNYKYQTEPYKYEENVVMLASNELYEIENYIEVLYPLGKSIPEFNNINEVDKNWIWFVVRRLINKIHISTGEESLISYDGVNQIANMIFGDDFKQKFPTYGNYYLKYENGYYNVEGYFEWPEGYCPSYIVNDVVKQEDNRYKITIIEYIADYIWDWDEQVVGEVKLYNDENYEKCIKEFSNYDRVIGESEIKDYVSKNANKFTKKELIIKLTEDNNFNIVSCKTIK